MLEIRRNNQFLKNIASKLNANDDRAIKYFEAYLIFLQFLGWVYSKNNKQFESDYNELQMIIPIELLIIWRLHEDIPSSYNHLRQIFKRKKGGNLIYFNDPISVWKANKEQLKDVFQKNREKCLVLCNNEQKRLINELFDFNATYQKKLRLTQKFALERKQVSIKISI